MIWSLLCLETVLGNITVRMETLRFIYFSHHFSFTFFLQEKLSQMSVAMAHAL